MRIDNVDGGSSLHLAMPDFRDGGPWAQQREFNLLESQSVDLRSFAGDNYLILLMPNPMSLDF